MAEMDPVVERARKSLADHAAESERGECHCMRCEDRQWIVQHAPIVEAAMQLTPNDWFAETQEAQLRRKAVWSACAAVRSSERTP
jgi:hypothetical protein